MGSDARTTADRLSGAGVGLRSGGGLAVFDPATGQAIGAVEDCGWSDMESMLDAVESGHADWASRSASERARVLNDWADRVEGQAAELARLLSLEQGKPLRESLRELEHSVTYIRWASGEASRLYGETVPGNHGRHRVFTFKEPVGVVAAITPWNFPASMVARKLAPALAAGCAVMLKPAETTPMIALELVHLLHEAGCPTSAVQVATTSVPSDFLAVVAERPAVAKISFTGSVAVGQQVHAACTGGVKESSLELGGNAPAIVFDDADITKAVKIVAGLKFLNAGQTCVAVNRIYVHRNVYDEFVARFVDRVSTFGVGNGLEEHTRIGPLISKDAVSRVERRVEETRDMGATAVFTGERPGNGSDGNFAAPTILADVDPEASLVKEEIFGPVAPVVAFDDEDQVLELANATRYGLASYVFTESLSRAFRVMEGLEFGMVAVNDGNLGAIAQAPFGGTKHSGMGVEGGREGTEEFLRTKLMSVSL